MQTILIEIESPTKAKELTSMLSSMNFVKKVTAVNKKTKLLSALQEHNEIKSAIVKNKNKAFAKHL